jgi:RIO kinase 1
VNDDETYLDEYEFWEEQFDPLRTDRKARRRRRPVVRHIPKKSQSQILDEITEPVGLEAGFNTTYQPSRYEADWLLSSLRDFYDQALISDILALVKGGKEASVYCCQADPTTGMELLAAKVYRPRIYRTMRNDHTYRRGRATLLLTPEGRPVETTDGRIMRAIRKKTSFGIQVQHTSWLMHEYSALERLYQAGAAVPQPVAASENAILMSYYGDTAMAAPTLNEIQLDSGEAGPLFEEVLRNIELMLRRELIHGDLSAYNILYWAGEIALIDFPQVTNPYTNDQAYFIFQRDIEHLCEYFGRQGVPCDPEVITDELWARHVGLEPHGPALDEGHLWLD